MNSKTDTPNSMDRLFQGLRKVNEERECVQEGAAEEAGQTASSSAPAEEQGKEKIEEAQEPQRPKRGRNSTKSKREQFLFRVDEDLITKARTIAHHHNSGMSDLLNYALRYFIANYEDKYGKVKSKGFKPNLDNLL